MKDIKLGNSGVIFFNKALVSRLLADSIEVFNHKGLAVNNGNILPLSRACFKTPTALGSRLTTDQRPSARPQGRRFGLWMGYSRIAVEETLQDVKNEIIKAKSSNKADALKQDISNSKIQIYYNISSILLKLFLFVKPPRDILHCQELCINIADY